MKKQFKIIILGILSINTVFAAEDNGYKSFNDITSALNPLEVIANHGGVRRSIDLNIQFALDSAEILPAASRQIEALGKAMQSPKLVHCNILLTGHTDATGDAGRNNELSKQRSNAVKHRLVDYFELSGSRFNTVGKGSSELIPKLAKNDAKHRRVTIELIDVEQCKKQANNSVKGLKKDKDGDIKVDW